MIESLIIAVFIISLTRRADVRFPGLVLGLTAVTNYALVVLFDLGGFSYCFTAAACDVLVILLVSFFAKTTRVSDTIVAISFVSILLNFDGWLLYVYELPLEPYNYSIAALYLIEILSLLRGDCANDYSRTNQRYSGLRLLSNKCRDFCFSLPKKART